MVSTASLWTIKSKHFLKQEKGMTIVDLYEDNYGDIYLATIGKGLLKYNQPAEEFIPILIKENKT